MNNVKMHFTYIVFKIGFRDLILLHNRQTSCALTFAAQMNLQRSLNKVALPSAEAVLTECYNPIWRKLF